MPMIPVKISPYWEYYIVRAGICNVADKNVDIILVLFKPSLVEMPNESSRKNVIAIMKMMIVIIGISEVNTVASSYI